MIGWRSLLFVPGHDAERLAKAASRGADAVILDLEDAVPTARKPSARAAARDAIEHLAAAGAPVVVRINAGLLDAAADLDAIVGPGLAAVMVPKAASADRLAWLAEGLEALEAARGMTAVPIALLPLVESPAALPRLPDLAGAPRVAGLAFGPEDFALEVGVAPSPACLDLACRQLILACAARGVAAFAAPVSIAGFRALDAFEAGLREARAAGAAGALCIHPSQVAVANRVFTATDGELAAAEGVIAAWDAAGAGGVAAYEGRMVDAPVVRRARQLLAKPRPAP